MDPMTKKKTSSTSQNLKSTAKNISKKTGLSSSIVFFLLIVILLLGIFAAEFFGITHIAQSYFPGVYAMFFPATPTPSVTFTPVPGPTESGSWGGGDWWQVYFTSPLTINDPEVQTSPIQTALIDLIESADSTIDMAVFEFDLFPVADALMAAEARGVEVRLVTDDEYGIEEDEYEGHDLFPTLEEHGVEVIDDDRSGLMHNKYLIVDRAIVWTGSTNLTVNGLYKNNNNVLVIRSEGLAAIYLNEFEEMWRGEFGARAESSVAEQRVNIGGTTLQAFFSPEDKPAFLIADLVRNAEETVYFMAFAFTQEDIGQAMIEKFQEGVIVSGIFETRGSETVYSELPQFTCLEMPVRQDGNPRTFHHKVIIIDGRWVVTGSFNFSNNANENNHENVLVIDNPEIADAYLLEFEKRWDEAVSPDLEDLTCP
jgi:phosphatidylserine/phosphatidylglycerophosphate/cardiolipin synthase-like enzyme